MAAILKFVESPSMDFFNSLLSSEKTLHFVVLDLLRQVILSVPQFTMTLCNHYNLLDLIDTFATDPKAAKMKIRIIVNLFSSPFGQVIILNQFDRIWNTIKEYQNIASNLCSEEYSAFIFKYAS